MTGHTGHRDILRHVFARPVTKTNGPAQHQHSSNSNSSRRDQNIARISRSAMTLSFFRSVAMLKEKLDWIERNIHMRLSTLVA
ncbi:hypothetical protein M0804_002289 [Polistes exclamans]|nr:hypothetical protein M0804_002289 [Polistes exclamans]